ncbi:MAG: inositol oxygenase family protein [bacterium]
MLETPKPRDYSEKVRPEVRETYRRNHVGQTLDFARAKRAEFSRFGRAKMTLWEALLELDRLIDKSDPDTEVSQLEHALQTAESLRREGAPEWLQLTGLIHDAGKILCLFGEEQWAVVGDTFPLGCAFSDKIIFQELLEGNSDRDNPAYASPHGIYTAGCGLDAVTMSWGHDEYLYQVVHGRIPEEAAFVIRFHSFYPLHQEHAYEWMLSARDRELRPWLRRFQRHALYSKSSERPAFAALARHYEELVARHLPDRLDW